MDGLAVKEVEFNGALLKAIQDLSGIVWVGVSWICNGIGLSKHQKDRQVTNIQNDSLLKEGCFKFEAGVFDPNNETLALQLDYLPAWLFKIKITPKMEKESPELAQRLKEYQLKAKDVLADAFLPEKKVIEPAAQQTVQLQFPDYEKKFNEISLSIEKLYAEMARFADIMLTWKTQIERTVTEKPVQKHETVIVDKGKEWRKSMYKMVDHLLLIDSRFEDRLAVMNYIRSYMTRNYGVVWAQEEKEYKERYGSHPKFLELVYDNENIRSIFECVLADLVGNVGKNRGHKPNTIEDIIRPLIEIRHDTSKNGCQTYRTVYTRMEGEYGVSWKNHMTRYMNENKPAKKPSKKELITNKYQLRKKFEMSVADLLSELTDGGLI